jgi:hypothetical protein
MAPSMQPAGKGRAAVPSPIVTAWPLRCARDVPAEMASTAQLTVTHTDATGHAHGSFPGAPTPRELASCVSNLPTGVL